MMRKILFWLICFIVLFLWGCGNNNQQNNTTTQYTTGQNLTGSTQNQDRSTQNLQKDDENSDLSDDVEQIELTWEDADLIPMMRQLINE